MCVCSRSLRSLHLGCLVPSHSMSNTLTMFAISHFVRSLRSLSLTNCPVLHAHLVRSLFHTLRSLRSLTANMRVLLRSLRSLPFRQYILRVATLTSFAPFSSIHVHSLSLTHSLYFQMDPTTTLAIAHSRSVFTRFARSLISPTSHTVRTLHSLCSLHSLNRYAHELLWAT